MDLSEVNENQNRHPWELSRTHIVLNELKRIGVHGNVLDIGCGDVFFDRALIQAVPVLTIWGVDINLKSEFHDKNLHAVTSIESLPDIKFDFILMMDVLEHIEDDKAFLAKIVQERLAGNGFVFITVPAFMSLYSLHDKELRHFRRYNHKQLNTLIENCLLKEFYWSYFYFSLVFARLLTKNKTENLSSWRKDEQNFVTRFFVAFLNADFVFCRILSKIGIHIPGLSLMCVCKKEKVN